MATIITLDKDKIAETDLSPLNQYVEWHKDNFQYFNLGPGKEHYKLLAYLSKTLNCKKLVELGTYIGQGTVALSYDESKEVHSYDIYSWFPEDGSITAENRENIQLHVCDYIDDMAEIIKDCSLVFLDIDHTGVTERIIMDALRKVGYKGLVLIDDTKLNDEMKSFYADIPEKKMDISDVGHWSGSGLVIMDPSVFEVVVE
jgi:predicted O-methyltransferase YrrM